MPEAVGLGSARAIRCSAYAESSRSRAVTRSGLFSSAIARTAARSSGVCAELACHVPTMRTPRRSPVRRGRRVFLTVMPRRRRDVQMSWCAFRKALGRSPLLADPIPGQHPVRQACRVRHRIDLEVAARRPPPRARQARETDHWPRIAFGILIHLPPTVDHRHRRRVPARISARPSSQPLVGPVPPKPPDDRVGEARRGWGRPLSREPARARIEAAPERPGSACGNQ